MGLDLIKSFEYDREDNTGRLSTGWLLGTPCGRILVFDTEILPTAIARTGLLVGWLRQTDFSIWKNS